MYRKQVLYDIRNAIIKTPSKKNQPSTYWTKEEQETRLVEAYNKWVEHGGVWSAAASKVTFPRQLFVLNYNVYLYLISQVHADQLEHVQKGCLARPREDISMDGSRIEGSHKGWNSIQRSQPSGIEVYTALGHDFVLRRNIRVASARIQENHLVNLHEFVTSTHTSHHVKLTNYIAALFNSLYQKEPDTSKSLLKPHPTLPEPAIFETMGLVESNNSLTYGGLVTIEDLSEPAGDEEVDPMLEDIDAEVAQMDQSRFMQLLGVTEDLISRPMVPLPGREISQAKNISKRKDRDENPIQTFKQPTDDSPGPIAKRRRVKSASSDAEHATAPDEDIEVLDLAIVDSVSIIHDLFFYIFCVLMLRLQPENTSECSTPAPTAPISCEPTDSIVDESGGAGIPLPGISTRHSGDARAFFSFQTTLDSMLAGSSDARVPATSHVSKTISKAHNSLDAHPLNLPQPSMSLENLRRPLKLPAALQAKGLTRSEILFSAKTSIDARALKIVGDDEFYLFMDMRAECQWTSFGMTAVKWASATQLYNTRLEALAKEKHFEAIKKSPRALADKLNEIEPKIMERIRRKEYTCTLLFQYLTISLLTN